MSRNKQHDYQKVRYCYTKMYFNIHVCPRYRLVRLLTTLLMTTLFHIIILARHIMYIIWKLLHYLNNYRCVLLCKYNATYLGDY